MSKTYRHENEDLNNNSRKKNRSKRKPKHWNKRDWEAFVDDDTEELDSYQYDYDEYDDSIYNR